MYRHALSVSAIVFLALAMGSAILRQNAAAQPAPNGPAEKWEYAMLRFSTADETKMWSLQEPAGTMHGTDAEMAQKLGLPAMSPGAALLTEVILNAAGRRGWELIAIRSDSGPILGETYYFKRRAL
jgi:hypothetical protein